MSRTSTVEFARGCEVLRHARAGPTDQRTGSVIRVLGVSDFRQPERSIGAITVDSSYADIITRCMLLHLLVFK
jgi:hypothetical protein